MADHAPNCAHCGGPAGIVSGAAIYPGRQDLAALRFWRCSPCGAWVGCHRTGNGRKPLGRPANAELRRARGILHERMVDPLWRGAIETCGYEPEDARARAIITRTARRRVYEFLADRLGIPFAETHVAMFDVEQCRAAWVALRGVGYPEIRAWAKARRQQQEAA